MRADWSIEFIRIEGQFYDASPLPPPTDEQRNSVLRSRTIVSAIRAALLIACLALAGCGTEADQIALCGLDGKAYVGRPESGSGFTRMTSEFHRVPSLDAVCVSRPQMPQDQR